MRREDRAEYRQAAKTNRQAKELDSEAARARGSDIPAIQPVAIKANA
jgi:hypothetical protein